MKYILCSDWLPSVARWGLPVLIPRKEKERKKHTHKTSALLDTTCDVMVTSSRFAPFLTNFYCQWVSFGAVSPVKLSNCKIITYIFKIKRDLPGS